MDRGSLRLGELWSAELQDFRVNLRSPTMTHNIYSVLRLEDPCFYEMCWPWSFGRCFSQFWVFWGTKELGVILSILRPLFPWRETWWQLWLSKCGRSRILGGLFFSRQCFLATCHVKICCPVGAGHFGTCFHKCATLMDISDSLQLRWILSLFTIAPTKCA